MGFFYLIEKYDRIRLSAYGFGELSAFLVPDVSWRRADQTRHRMSLSIFAHIDTDHGMSIVEKLFRKGFGGLGFSDSGRSEEEEASDRFLGIRESRFIAGNSFGDQLQGIILPDHV